MQKIAVIGLGKFGESLVRELRELGAEVLALDLETDLVERIKEVASYAAEVDAMDEEALRAVGIEDMEAAVVGIGGNVEANLLITLLLKKLQIDRIWARAINPLQVDILKAIGVDHIINPEEEVGRLSARALLYKNINGYVPLKTGASVAEVSTPEHFVGKTLRELDLRKNNAVMVLAIQHAPEADADGAVEMENVPDPDRPLHAGDTLLVVGTDKHIMKVAKA